MRLTKGGSSALLTTSTVVSTSSAATSSARALPPVESVHDLARLQVDHLDAAVTVAGPELVELRHGQDPVRARRVTRFRRPDETFDARLQHVRLDVEDVDRFVRAVGEVIGPVGDEADIEGGELLARNLDCRDTLDRRAFAASAGVAEDKLANPSPSSRCRRRAQSCELHQSLFSSISPLF
jgi:hypothetical protein